MIADGLLDAACRIDLTKVQIGKRYMRRPIDEAEIVLLSSQLRRVGPWPLEPLKLFVIDETLEFADDTQIAVAEAAKRMRIFKVPAEVEIIGGRRQEPQEVIGALA